MELPAWLTQPPWWLQLIIYALLTGIIAPIVLERYRESKKRKEAERTRRVEESKAKIERLRSEISATKFNLVEAVDDDLTRVKETKFFDETPSRENDILSTARQSQDLSKIAERYVEAIREAVDWRDANRKLLKVVISDLVASNFSKTIASNQPESWAGWKALDVAFQTLLINNIVKGERINRDFLEQLGPQLCIQIEKASSQGEGIPRFLSSLNETIAKDPYLRRFREKQETIRALGDELKKTAQGHISKLQYDLDKWQSFRG